jgi:hypothetical protein
MDNSPDYTLLDDPALLAARARLRAELDEATALPGTHRRTRPARTGRLGPGQRG